jgi:hypothetical protein
MGLFDAATGGLTGGAGGLFGGGPSQATSTAGDVRGDVSSGFGDFIVGSGASKDGASSSASWITAAASVAGLAVTLYLAYKAGKK